jgi:hypothetical protein
MCYSSTPFAIYAHQYIAPWYEDSTTTESIAPTHSWPRHWMGWVVSVTLRPRFTLVPMGWESGWASELFWTQGLERKFFTSSGDRTPIVQSVVRHYTDWATRLTQYLVKGTNYETLDTHYSPSSRCLCSSDALYRSFAVRDQVWRSYKTTDKVVVFYISAPPPPIYRLTGR